MHTKAEKMPVYQIGETVEYFRRGISYVGIIRQDLGILKGAGRRYRITPPDGEHGDEDEAYRNYFEFDVAERFLCKGGD